MPTNGQLLRVLVCGSREWTDIEPIRRELAKLPRGSTVIHGGCRGADLIAGHVAKQLGLAVDAYPAEWEKYGRSAGPRRNQLMLDDGRPDVVYAFHPDLAHSRGTGDMVRRARLAGIRIENFIA